MHAVLERVKENGVVAILRGVDPQLVVPLGKALIAAGVGGMEITLNSEGALEGIDVLKKELGGQILVGAGTVMTGDLAKQAIAAGAMFLLTPHLSEEVLAVCREANIPCIAGVMTPSEAVRAYTLGAEMVKIFPAGSLGPEYFKDLRGPLPQIVTMAVGGVSINNAEAFIKAGAVAIGAGSQLLDMAAIARGDWEAVQKKAAAMVAAVRKARS
jgi:2-dehydro-3-deoxyphosphogluconate aldolase/(4S)-4-hydroxy-2-oxoglutarate aldolase